MGADFKTTAIAHIKMLSSYTPLKCSSFISSWLRLIVHFNYLLVKEAFLIFPAFGTMKNSRKLSVSHLLTYALWVKLSYPFFSSCDLPDLVDFIDSFTADMCSTEHFLDAVGQKPKALVRWKHVTVNARALNWTRLLTIVLFTWSFRFTFLIWHTG